MDETGWINGQYVARAVACSLSSKAKYPNSPIVYIERQEEETQKTEHECGMHPDALRFWAFAQNFNRDKFGTQPEITQKEG